MRNRGLGFRNAVRALALVLALRPAALFAAEPMPLRADLQIPLILKILTYDRHLESKAGAQLMVGVVYAPTDVTSVAAANEVSDVLFRFQDKTVKRLPIRFRLVEYTTPEALERTVERWGISVFYVAPGSARNLDGIKVISQKRGVTTTTGVPDYVRRGLSVGLGLSDDRPQILVNQASARAEGSEFDASLLRISVPVK
ncbi:MAG TPA: YfiR family protein [Vicinamibacteria bacterium]|nr:YfiR family protein [Vicinamibacteria bacterium]